MEKIHENMCFDVVFLFENIGTCSCFHVFSPFSAHFYPPLHHNGKGSIPQLCPYTMLMLKLCSILVFKLPFNSVVIRAVVASVSSSDSEPLSTKTSVLATFTSR